MKIRGKRRRAAAAEREAAGFTISLGDSDAYDLWHVHFDWWGAGRLGLRYRQSYLGALFTAFRRTLVLAESSAKPVQVFVSIAPWREAGQDALYVDTENSSGTELPAVFSDTEWGAAPPPFLREFLAGGDWEVGRSRFKGDFWYYVRPRSGEDQEVAP